MLASCRPTDRTLRALSINSRSRATAKALTARLSFQPGTNFAAWLFRIQRNEFISGLRRQRPTVQVDTAVAESLTHPPQQDSGLIMREFLTAFSKLAVTQREALLLAVLEGLPYDVIADRTGVSAGTVKSRISRARAKLEYLLTEGEPTIGQNGTAEANPAVFAELRPDRG